MKVPSRSGSRLLLAVFLSVIPLCGWGLLKSPPERAILPNGLRVIVMEDHSLPIVAVQLAFPHGRLVGVPGKPAALLVLADLLTSSDLRHMTRHELIAGLEAKGISSDLAFGQRTMGISLSGPTDSLDYLLENLRPMVFDLQPSQEQLDKAKTRILRGLQDERNYPLLGGYLTQAAARTLFPDAPFARGSAVTPEDVGLVSLADVQALLEKIIVPNNAVISIVGDLDPSATIRQSMKAFGDLQALIVEPEAVAPSPAVARPDARPEKREFLPIDTTQVMISFPAPGPSDPDRIPLLLWATALKEANNALLAGFVQQNFPGLRSLQANYVPLAGQGMFVIGFICENPEVDRTIGSILNFMMHIGQEKLRGEDVQKWILLRRNKESMQQETRAYLANDLAQAELEKDFSLASGILPALSRVTVADMQRVAASVFGGGKFAVNVVHPLSCQLKAEIAPSLLSLDNGARILLKPYFAGELAAICYRLEIPLGAIPEGKEALPRLLSSMLSMTGEQAKDSVSQRLRQELDLIAGQVTVMAGYDAIYVTGFADRRHLPKLAGLIQERLTQRDLAKVEFEAARRAVLEEVTSGPISALAKVFQAFMDKGFPGCGHIGKGPTSENLQAVTMDDLKRFQEQLLRGPNVTCIVVGNVEGEQVLPDLKTLLAGLPKERLAPVAAPAFCRLPLETSQEVEIDLGPDQDEALIGVGYRLPAAAHSSDPASQTAFLPNLVLFHMLTWSRNGLIMQRLIESGLAYALLFPQYQTTREFGWVFFAIRLAPDKLEAAKVELRKVLAELPSLPVEERHIKSAAQTVGVYLIRSMERSADQAASLAAFYGNGMPPDFLDDLGPGLARLEPATVKEAAARYFQNYFMVIGKPGKK